MIKIQDYSELALRTRNDLGHKLNVCHAHMGIIDETGELNQACAKLNFTNMKEEVGDLLWFTNLLLTEFTDVNINIEQVVNGVINDYDELIKYEPNENLFYELNNLIKGYVAYNKPNQVEIINKALEMVKYCTCCLFDRNSTAEYRTDIMLEVLTKNIEKLKVRFPEKYSDYSAQNRDLDSELQVLEKK